MSFTMQKDCTNSFYLCLNFSDGDYKYREDAKTFQKEFYYVNFLDKIGEFESKFSENYREKNHARNKAKWYANNKWALIKIDYKVINIGLYSSIYGHIESFKVI